MSLIRLCTCCPSAIRQIRTVPSMRAATTPGSQNRVAGMSASQPVDLLASISYRHPALSSYR